METIKAINDRRSIRKFKSIDVKENIIEILLNAAQMAPSAGNVQGRDYIIVTDPEIKNQLVKAAYDQKFIGQAPIVIIFIANIERSSNIYGGRGLLYSIQDATVSVMNLMLVAQDLGLGTCWVGAFDGDYVKDILKIPIELEIKPIAIIPIGYPDEVPVMPQRMSLDKLLHWEKW
jgi:nitroreductase